MFLIMMKEFPHKTLRLLGNNVNPVKGQIHLDNLSIYNGTQNGDDGMNFSVLEVVAHDVNDNIIPWEHKYRHNTLWTTWSTRSWSCFIL